MHKGCVHAQKAPGNPQTGHRGALAAPQNQRAAVGRRHRYGGILRDQAEQRKAHMVHDVVDVGPDRIEQPPGDPVDHQLVPAGGFSFVATVLAELREATDFSDAAKGVFKTARVADIQRLGYVYDEVLGDHSQAAVIYEQLRAMAGELDSVLLSPTSHAEVQTKNGKWKILVNTYIELDDL